MFLVGDLTRHKGVVVYQGPEQCLGSKLGDKGIGMIGAEVLIASLQPVYSSIANIFDAYGYNLDSTFVKFVCDTIQQS